MGRSADYLSATQIELLEWVADGCPDGKYEGTTYRISARALANRGYVEIGGSGARWSAKITPHGASRLVIEAGLVEAKKERDRLEDRARAERVRREEQQRQEREREERRLFDQVAKLVEDVVAAGGRLELGSEFQLFDVKRMLVASASEKLCPQNQRLAQEPTRMDPTLGVTVYLEPDFEAMTGTRTIAVPPKLQDPHPAVATFLGKRRRVSERQIPRAARILQALISAAPGIGAVVAARTPEMALVDGTFKPDLSLRLPSGELVVEIRELDKRGGEGLAFTIDYDHGTRADRANRDFRASGDLEVRICRPHSRERPMAWRDTEAASLEAQLPDLIRLLEVSQAEAEWADQEAGRRSAIRAARWNEVKREAFKKVSFDRNVKQVLDQLKRRKLTLAMRAYADEIEAQTDSENTEVREWVAWIRQYADGTDPLNGKLVVEIATSAGHDELEPHMLGWSTYGPHRTE